MLPSRERSEGDPMAHQWRGGLLAEPVIAAALRADRVARNDGGCTTTASRRPQAW